MPSAAPDAPAPDSDPPVALAAGSTPRVAARPLQAKTPADELKSPPPLLGASMTALEILNRTEPAPAPSSGTSPVAPGTRPRRGPIGLKIEEKTSPDLLSWTRRVDGVEAGVQRRAARI